MTTTLAQLEHWLRVPAETENLEFKEAKQQYDTHKLMRYCVAIANEGGGHLVLGVTDRPPRRVVGSAAFADLAAIAAKLYEKLRFRVDAKALTHQDGRVVVFSIPSRPRGAAYHLDGSYLMRSTEDTVPMSEDRLRSIFAEGQPDWLEEPAVKGVPADEVVELLDTQTYFELLNLPLPGTRAAVLSRLESERLVERDGAGWTIRNLGALLLARRLSAFGLSIERKAPRLVVYEGTDKLRTRLDRLGQRGYAVGFENLVRSVHDMAPMNEVLEQTVRQEVRMFPQQAVRELVANALVHQDFAVQGAGVMIEMYADRVEFTNPGTPPIRVERFIDEYRSRNERLADLMRRLGICEEKGSGVDKVVHAAEVAQLPAPDFRTDSLRTIAVLFGHREFKDMGKADRVRACYQHCCLMYVSNQRMGNQSLRERLGLAQSKMPTVSQIIGDTQEAKLIRLDDAQTTSKRYARYVPFWA